MKRHLKTAGLVATALVAAPTTLVAQTANCGLRVQVIEKLQSKYDEHLTAGGLQSVSDKQSVMEIWASSETGTFTVLLTNPQGISCVVAVGTDFFKTAEAPDVKGSAL
ncbi:MAG: hypothetical protein AAGF27_08535 [Pseudomonadota bacterium]